MIRLLTDRRTLILAPTGRDSDLIAGLLSRAALPCHISGSVAELAGEVQQGAGAAIISEEALGGDVIPQILEVLNEQPSWSDFPLILLTVGGQVTAESERLRELRRPLGNRLPARTTYSSRDSARHTRNRTTRAATPIPDPRPDAAI